MSNCQFIKTVLTGYSTHTSSNFSFIPAEQFLTKSKFAAIFGTKTKIGVTSLKIILKVNIACGIIFKARMTPSPLALTLGISPDAKPTTMNRPSQERLEQKKDFCLIFTNL